MSRLKKAVSLVKQGDFLTLWNKFKVLFYAKLHYIRSRYEDKRIGNIPLNSTIPSKYQELGAFATQSTDYACLDAIFKSCPLKKDDVFVDVGCGQGRVLTYLYLRKFRGDIIGIELDTDVAQIAEKRTVNCSNIEICCSNILECEDVIEKGTAFYLFNPFDGKILLQFVNSIEKNCRHPVRLYYCNDLYREIIDNRDNWSIAHRKVIKRRHAQPMSYSIYEYSPF